MKFFNYEEIYILAHGDPSKMLEYFKDSTEGPNFIVNPKALVDAFWISDRDKAEYLGLCSLRSYNNYLHDGNVDLSLDLVPMYIPMSVVIDNPLTQITDETIVFKKEK